MLLVIIYMAIYLQILQKKLLKYTKYRVKLGNRDIIVLIKLIMFIANFINENILIGI